MPSISDNRRSRQLIYEKLSSLKTELEKVGSELEQAFKEEEDRARFLKLNVVELLWFVREGRLMTGGNLTAERVMGDKFKIFGTSLKRLLSRKASMFSSPDDVFLFLQLHGYGSEFFPMSDDDDDELLSTPAFGSSGGNETSSTGVEPMQIEFAT